MGSDLNKRLFTGIIFLIVMVAGILTSQFTLLLLFSAIVFLGSQEFAKMTSIVYPWLHSVFNLLLFLAIFLENSTSLLLFITAAIGYAVLIIIGKRDTYSLAMTLLGALLVPLAFGLLSDSLVSGEQRFGILFFFILLWTNDSMAYVTGRLLGRHKLWERISPNKTWEGFFGGVIFAMIVSYFIHDHFGVNSTDALAIAFIVGVFGTLGDLIESSLKRKFGVKDSGSILPGHGGILDRFDGVMLAAPMVFFYLTFVNRG